MEEAIFQWFSQYPYEPLLVYAAIFGVMSICALGVPLPEEVVIVSAGILGHMSLNPQDYPPPYLGARSVTPIELAIVCFGSVIVTDYIVYSLGRFFGKKIINSKRFNKHFSKNRLDKIQKWADNYGAWAPGIFRFIPGLRFPGHMMCGALSVKTWKFLLTDGFAALISVPTQVLLVSYYGDTILNQLKKFKLIVFCILAIFIVGFFAKKYLWDKPEATT